MHIHDLHLLNSCACLCNWCNMCFDIIVQVNQFSSQKLKYAVGNKLHFPDCNCSGCSAGMEEILICARNVLTHICMHNRGRKV